MTHREEALLQPIELTCRPGKAGHMLTFPYSVSNNTSADIYVMHAMPSLDRAGDDPAADEQAAVVILGSQNDVILGKFAAPLPTDRRIAVPVIPLAHRLRPGAELHAQLGVPLPLAESSPYFPDLTLREYEVAEIKAVVFTIGYWPDGIDGLVAAPTDYSPDLFNVITRHALRTVRNVAQRFPTAGLQILKRKDAFPRSFGPQQA